MRSFAVDDELAVGCAQGFAPRGHTYWILFLAWDPDGFEEETRCVCLCSAEHVMYTSVGVEAPHQLPGSFFSTCCTDGKFWVFGAVVWEPQGESSQLKLVLGISTLIHFSYYR